jgi:glutamate synthase domain-containing protein 2
MNIRLPGGIPDFVEKWNPQKFYQVGYGLTATSAISLPTIFYDGIAIHPVLPLALAGFTAMYWKIGLADLKQTGHSLRRNFPFLCHLRYIFESIRPEIQQYFIESDSDASPFSRSMRSVIYQRSKAQADTTALGTRRNVYAEGYEWGMHSMFPKNHHDVKTRVTVGLTENGCKQPYSASIFNISAMSYGALSGPAVEALNRGAARGGFYHNTGEGGISKFHLSGGDIVWNVGTGYFACGKTVDGVRKFNPDMFATNSNRPEVKMIEIKMSQGAKPAHGGILPANKITQEISDARGLGPGPWTEDCASPPFHDAFKTPLQMMEFITQLRTLSGGKPIGFKLCVGSPTELCALIHAMRKSDVYPDFITVDGAEGGTGAAPPEFQDSIGMPMAEGLRLLDNLLRGAGIRDRIKIIAAGKVYNGFSLVRTFANGADVVNAARAFMFSLGCIQALKCNTNKCPTGITTQDKALNAGLDITNKQIRVSNFHAGTVLATQEIVAAMGLTDPSDVTGAHLWKRKNGIHISNYTDMHDSYLPEMKGGELLEEGLANVPGKMYKQWWKEGEMLCDGLGK